ncbi:MAG: hypothetical protein Q8905_17470 [Bacteroidota bacterium]|nr:hypothetical protein [Bacteroidota bacterium]
MDESFDRKVQTILPYNKEIKMKYTITAKAALGGAPATRGHFSILFAPHAAALR